MGSWDLNMFFFPSCYNFSLVGERLHSQIKTGYQLVGKLTLNTCHSCCARNSSFSLLRSAVGKTHDLRSDLWWTIPLCPGALCIYLIIFGIPFGSQPIKSALARHSGVQVPVVPATYGSTWVVLWLLFCRSALCSLSHGPLSRVHFGESLVVRLYSEIDHIHLSSEVQPSFTPGGLPHSP